MVQEDQLNGRIASAIRKRLVHTNWQVSEETTDVFQDNILERPDILITRPGSEPPIILENEYRISHVEQDAVKRLGKTLTPDYGGTTINTVIGIYSPQILHDAPNGDEADALLESGVHLQYAVYTGNSPTEFDRFPQSGFIQGDISALIEFIRPAVEPSDIIQRAADDLARGADTAAKMLTETDRLNPDMQIGVKIAEKLRQPWPIGSSTDAKQQAAIREARRQTANMTTTIIINALAYQQILDKHNGIKGFTQLRQSAHDNQLTQDLVIKEFNHILSINYWPIFHIAKELLLEIPATDAKNMLRTMAETADNIFHAIQRSDVAGTVFQKLIADRKTLKAYYTTPEATTLLAHLAIPENLDWANPETLRNYSIADYACGSGGLILAAYQRARDLHRLHGGDPDACHSDMMRHALTACDIMPAGVHLTASLLSSVAPKVTYDATRCILFPFGGKRKVDKDGQVILDAHGNPEKETDGNGKPIVSLGSIEMLGLNQTNFQAVLPQDEQASLGAQGERSNIEVDMPPFSQSLVVMNPPFTKPTKHAPRSSEHVDPKNPAFASFGTTDEEQRLMKQRESRLGKGTISDGNAGLGTTFAAIAHKMVKPGGHIALILPTAAMMGGSYDRRKDQAYSWQRLRNLIYEHYENIVVVSVAQPRVRDSAFSADSNFPDCIVIAQSLAVGASTARRHTAHFVNLTEMPKTKLDAQETARAIKIAIRAAQEPGERSLIHIGDDNIGFVRLETISRNRRWTTLRIANSGIVERTRMLAQGALRLPQSECDIPIPMTTLEKLGNVGPLHRDIVERGPFIRRDGCDAGSEYPMLWNHYPIKKSEQKDKDPQKSMLTRPDSNGEVRKGKRNAARAMWDNAAHLHINARFNFNANSTSAAYTAQKSLGGSMWPAFQMQTPEQEKALCVWLNSALGMAIYWLESDRGQDGRGGTTVTAIPSIPALDIPNLTPAQTTAAAAIFDDLSAKPMLPANESWRDPVRQDLDRRLLTQVLNLDAAAVEQLAIFRLQWCKEPTVTSAKKTGPPD